MTQQFKVYGMFFFYALTLGSIFPRLGELQLAMGIGESALGLGLLGLAIGTQITLMLGGKLVDRFGHRGVMLFGVPMLGLAEIATTMMPTVGGFFACLLIGGLAIGALEIVVNLEADRTEHLIGRRIMNRAHAFWSFGFFAAGIVGAAAAQAGISPNIHIAGVLVVEMTLMTLLLRGFEPAPSRVLSEGDHPRFVRPSKGILLLVLFTLSAMVLEGAGADWSVIFMRDSFSVSPFVNGMAFAIGAFAQAVTRYFADPYIDKYGPTRVARLLILLLGLGAVMVTLSPSAGIALLGFALIGVGGSSIFPLAMSAAAQRTDRPAAANVAALAQLAFVAFLIAPPVLGYVAEHFGIRLSFGMTIPLVLVSWFAVRSLAEDTK